MCLILLAYKTDAARPLVLAANRDEFYARPTRRAEFWEDAPGLLAGRDVTGGGTWLGVTRAGRVAAVTNFREPSRADAHAPSRGRLVTDFLRGTDGPRRYLEQLAPRASAFNGFNLLVGDARTLLYFSNRAAPAPLELRPGVYGLSNHLLDTPWPKVARGKKSLAEALDGDGAPATDALFRVLADAEPAPDESLPDTGVGLERERTLSPLFIRGAAYGTRASTVVIFDARGRATFVERAFEAGETHEARFEFELEAAE